jgi:methyl-CpG-binding domain protein 4|tara:strand:+ start:470 stop:892 length:423 start_codon:yes stop_codon:yes gene_type:complete
MIKIRNLRLLQDIYKNDPWKMLVCCIMLNLTTRKQVDKVRHKLFDEFPTPKALANAKLEELSELLMPLGMQYKRAATLKRFSQEYIDGFTDPIKLHGIGKYAKDSWEIFQNNNLNVQPTDKVLNLYLATALEMQTQMGHS